MPTDSQSLFAAVCGLAEERSELRWGQQGAAFAPHLATAGSHARAAHSAARRQAGRQVGRHGALLQPQEEAPDTRRDALRRRARRRARLPRGGAVTCPGEEPPSRWLGATRRLRSRELGSLP